MKFTNFGKKLFALLAVVLFGVVLVACNNPTPDPDPVEPTEQEKHQANVNAVLNAIVFDQTQLDEVTGDLILVDKNGKYPDVTITWTSSETDLIANDGKVTRPALDDARIEEGKNFVKVEVTVTAKQGEATGTKSFTFKVISEKKVAINTVQEIKASFYTLMQEAGKKYSDKTSDMGIKVEVTGTLLYKVSNKGYLVSDGTGAIYVYGTTTANVGDTVKVSGNAYAYYGLIELGSDVNCEVVEAKAVPALTFRETTVEDYTSALDAALDADGKIVDVNAFVGFSTEALRLYAKVEKGDKGSGDTYYLADPETGKSVAIYHYCTDAEADAAKIEAFVGKYVNINVYSYDTHSSLADKYRVVWDGSEIVEAEAPELNDLQKVENTLSSLTLDAQVIENVELPVVEGVTWALKAVSANAEIAEGVLKVTRPAYNTGDAKVVVVATCTIGEVTKTKEIEVVVLEAFDPTIEEVSAFDSETIYKFGFYQANTMQYLFSTGAKDGNYGSTVENAKEAAGFKVVTVEGGYQLQVILGEATKYFELAQSGKYTNVMFNDTPTEGFVWQYNAEYNTFTYEFTEGDYAGVYYAGTYNKYATLSASTIDKAATSFVGHLYKAEGHEVAPVEAADAAISFADVANRVSQDTEQQVWSQNGITVTNNKSASTTNVADYSNPARFYANSDLIIEYTENIQKIVITTAGGKNFKSDFTLAGCTVTVEGTVCTIELDTPATSVEIIKLAAQIRVATIEVYTA